MKKKIVNFEEECVKALLLLAEYFGYSKSIEMIQNERNPLLSNISGKVWPDEKSTPLHKSPKSSSSSKKKVIHQFIVRQLGVISKSYCGRTSGKFTNEPVTCYHCLMATGQRDLIQRNKISS